MKIRNWMTPDPITVGPETLLLEARGIMSAKHIRRLPVIDAEGGLVGIVTQRRILAAMPSQASPLSVEERNLLLTRLRVGQIMQKKPITVSPEDFVMDAIGLGREKGVGAFPVVEADGRLVGIVTGSDIFDAILRVISARPDQTMLILEKVEPDGDQGRMSRIAGVIEHCCAPVEAIFSLPQGGGKGREVYIKASASHAQRLRRELGAAGYHLGQ